MHSSQAYLTEWLRERVVTERLLTLRNHSLIPPSLSGNTVPKNLYLGVCVVGRHKMSDFEKLIKPSKYTRLVDKLCISCWAYCLSRMLSGL